MLNPFGKVIIFEDKSINLKRILRSPASGQPADLTLTFRNLEMTNLTPYSGKFAGRRIDSGKLSVDLEYKVKQRQLAGENTFVIHRLKLGERVVSPDAMKLPLDLAIGLLEDSNGNIDLDLPISGSLDDSKFSSGKIVWKAIVNVLTKLVTALFCARGSLFGISADQLEAAEFDFGSKTLLPQEQEKLKGIGQALAKRPQLPLSIVPAYEIQGDTRAIQQFWIRRDVAQGMGLKIVPDPEPGPVDVAGPRALEALYEARFEKQGGVKAIKAEFEKAREATGKPPHLEMLERPTLRIPVTGAELQRLATARGEAMKQALVSFGQVDAVKISVGEPVKNPDGGKRAASKLSPGAGQNRAADPASAVRPAVVIP